MHGCCIIHLVWRGSTLEFWWVERGVREGLWTGQCSWRIMRTKPGRGELCKGATRGGVTCKGRLVWLAGSARRERHRVRRERGCLVPGEGGPASISQQTCTGCLLSARPLLRHTRGKTRWTKHGRVAKDGSLHEKIIDEQNKENTHLFFVNHLGIQKAEFRASYSVSPQYFTQDHRVDLTSLLEAE